MNNFLSQLPGPKELLQAFTDRVKESLTLLEPGDRLRDSAEALHAEYMERLSPRYQDPAGLFGKKALWWTTAQRLKAMPDAMAEVHKDGKVAAAMQALHEALGQVEAAVNNLPDTPPLPEELQAKPEPDYESSYSSDTRKTFYKQDQ